MYVAETKELISCGVTAQLIWVFVFTYYAKSKFSHLVTHFVLQISKSSVIPQ